VILGSGCFDGLHSGHARYFSTMKKLAQEGEAVYVAIAPDFYIESTKDRKPHWSQHDRWRTVLECGVNPLMHEAPSVAQTILQQKPRLFVKGSDWAGKLPEDVVKACREVGAIIVYVDTPGTHTSEALG
jgi:cytidyltransferase-like protein